MLRAEIIGEWPCRESKFVKFTTTAAVTTKLRVEVVLILLVLRVQIFLCLEQKLPAVRRPTIGQSPPPPDYHGGRVLNDVDNNLEARRSRKPAVA